MSRRNSKRAEQSGWARAAVGSCVVHVLVLLGLWRSGASAPAMAEAAQVVVELKADQKVWDDVVPPAAALPDPPAPAIDEAVVPRPRDAPEGDRDNAVAETVAPRVGERRERATPAADRGEDGGRLPGARDAARSLDVAVARRGRRQRGPAVALAHVARARRRRRR